MLPISSTAPTTPNESTRNTPSFRKVQNTYPESSRPSSFRTPNPDFNNPAIPIAEPESQNPRRSGPRAGIHPTKHGESKISIPINPRIISLKNLNMSFQNRQITYQEFHHPCHSGPRAGIHRKTSRNSIVSLDPNGTRIKPGMTKDSRHSGKYKALIRNLNLLLPYQYQI